MSQAPPDRVREALAHLYDPGYLQMHALAAAAGGGKGLRSALEQAIDALEPARDGKGGPRAERRHALLSLRYLDALAVDEVRRRLLISRSEYYREHQEALGAVASVLAERLARRGPVGPGPPAPAPHWASPAAAPARDLPAY